MAADTVERCSFEARLECHYLLHAPAEVDERTLLVLALHGYGSNPEVMLRLTKTMLGDRHAIASVQAPSQFYPANAPESTVGYCWTSHVHSQAWVRLHHEMVRHVTKEAGGRFGIGAAPVPGGRGAGEGFHVRPVHGQRRTGVLELCRDGRLEQVIADALQRFRRQPVRLVLAEGGSGQAEGPLGLPVGQRVQAVLPVCDHAEPPLVRLGKRGQRLVHAGQVGGPAIGLGQAHAGQQGADRQLPGAHPGGSMTSSCGATPKASMISSNAASGIMAGGPPRAV